MAALTAANTAFLPTEKDGYGMIAAAGKRVARGRYLFPSQFAGYLSGLPERFVPFASEENRIPIGTDVLICHGRTSTNARGLDNVHPFQKGNLYLAHNGIVSWTGPKEDAPTPVCDSEQVLHWLAANNQNFHGLETVFSGFGAVALYDASTGILTVARDGASLYVARRNNNAGWIMATTLEILRSVCKRAKIGIDTNPIVFPKCIIRFKGGSMLTDEDWNGFGNRPWSADDYKSYGHVGTGAVVPYKSAQESSVVFTREGKQINAQGQLVPLGTSEAKEYIFPEESEVYDDDDFDDDETEVGRFPDDTETFTQPVAALPELEEDADAFPDYEGTKYPPSYEDTKYPCKIKIKNANDFFES